MTNLDSSSMRSIVAERPERCAAFPPSVSLLSSGESEGWEEERRGPVGYWVSGAWCECNALSVLLVLSELRRDQLGAARTRGISDKHETVIYWLQTRDPSRCSSVSSRLYCILLVILLSLTFKHISLLISGVFYEMNAFSISESWFKYFFNNRITFLRYKTFIFTHLYLLAVYLYLQIPACN